MHFQWLAVISSTTGPLGEGPRPWYITTAVLAQLVSSNSAEKTLLPPSSFEPSVLETPSQAGAVSSKADKAVKANKIFESAASYISTDITVHKLDDAWARYIPFRVIKLAVATSH